MDKHEDDFVLLSPDKTDGSFCKEVAGLRRSRFSGLILLLYRALNCRRRWRVGKLLIELAMRAERGAIWSYTARKIMRDFHGVEIGAYSYGNCFDPAAVPPGVCIGRYTSIAPNARFIVQNHPLDSLSTHPAFYESEPGNPATADLPAGHLKVGNDVWVGYNAVVTPGCKSIGCGAVIGAGTIVTRDVPDFAVVVGNPGRVIRRRFSPSERALIKETRWWELAPNEVKRLQTKLNIGEHTADNERQPTSASKTIASIIIPAHNEGEVIGRCLRSLLEDAKSSELEVIVVGNGCNDSTCDIANGFGADVCVLETSAASKVAALNLGDRTASHFPRIYLDADVVMSIHAVRDTCRVLNQGEVLAAAPRIAWNLARSNVLVRAFYRIWRFQPYFDNGRIGSGVYAVNKQGHQRIIQFPEVTADDEFVRRLFLESERATAFEHHFTVTPPKTLRQLVLIKSRSRRGNMQLRKRIDGLVPDTRGRHVQFALRLLVRPHLWPSMCIYVWVVLATSLRALRTLHHPQTGLWERDLSSRQASA